MKDIAIIIVNYNLTQEVRKLLLSIREHIKKENIQIVVVDSNSPDKSIYSLVETFPEVKFIFLDKNYGFGYSNNIGVKQVPAKYYLFLNPDTHFFMDSISDLYFFMEEHPTFGVVGPQLVYENGDKQISGLRVHNLLYVLLDIFQLLSPFISLEILFKEKLSSENYYFVGYVLGACLMVRQEVLKKVGLFDEDYFLFAEEVDLCLRIKKYTNYKIVFWKGTTVVHSKGKITNKIRAQRIQWSYESILIFLKKHFSPFKIKIYSFLVILLLIKRYLIASLKKAEDRENLLKTYLYLIRYFYRGEPKLNPNL